ncbi:60S ribosomal protein L29 [Myotis brandtii]|uniref:60S ribosomal protein L29 n=1 Tax=Myotis brandtii TaxID=109478 RepID=S7PPX0_MYOBR|nr:60S ribosomal protein L29 [Myotis brandtii]
MLFPKKHNKKGLKKVLANNAKAMRACAEAIKAHAKPKEVKPSIPRGGSHKLDQLPYITHSKPGKCADAHITKDVRLCGTKSKTQAALQLRGSGYTSGSGSQSCPGPHEGSRVEAFVC